MWESRGVTWRLIEFRSCVWPVDMVSAQRNIYESYVGMSSKTFGFRNANRHARCAGAVAARCEVVGITQTKWMKEKKEKSRGKNVVIYCMLFDLCKFIIFVNSGRS